MTHGIQVMVRLLLAVVLVVWPVRWVPGWCGWMQVRVSVSVWCASCSGQRFGCCCVWVGFWGLAGVVMKHFRRG